MPENPPELSESIPMKKFLQAVDYKSLAAAFEITADQLKYYVYQLKGRKNYISFTIPKKGGGNRVIYAPQGGLKIIQKKLSDILTELYKPRHCTKGFVPNEGIVENAKVHAGRKGILNIDLKDFFPSVNYGRVYGLFRSEPFKFNKVVASCLGKMCCYRNGLPQGAPTSPILSNMICLRLDRELQIFARTNNLFYTRYADDITFSTDFKQFPKNVVVGKLRNVEIGEALEKIIKSNGFEINHNKSRVLYWYNRQIVTGLVVNNQVNVQRRYIRGLRGAIHSIQKFGIAAAEVDFQKRYTKTKHESKSVPTLKNYLKGKMAFLQQVRGKQDATYQKLQAALHELLDKDFPPPISDFHNLVHRWDELKHPSKRLSVQDRGFMLQDFFNDLLTYFRIEIKKSYKVPGTDDQIDSGFIFNHHAYVVECKWTKSEVGNRQLDELKGVLDRLGDHALGVFFAVNGWSKNVIPALQRGSRKRVLLLNGEDIEDILYRGIHLPDMITHKINQLNFFGLPYSKYVPLEVREEKASLAKALSMPVSAKAKPADAKPATKKGDKS